MGKSLEWYEKRLPHLDVEGVEDKCFEYVHGILYIHDAARGETKAYAQGLMRHYFYLTDKGELYDGDFQRWYEAVKNCDVEIMTDKRKAIEELVSATFLLWGSFRDCAGGAN